MVRNYQIYIKGGIPYLLIGIVSLYMFRGIFGPGFMSGYDNSIHFYESYYLCNVLLPQYHWIGGWTMDGMAGCPILLHHPQIGFLIIAFLNKALFIPLNLAYKITLLATYAFLGMSFYKISSYRFGKMAAALIALCLMLQKDIYCDKILYGIWNNFVGIGLFFIFLHILDKNLKHLKIGTAAALGLTLGILILAHLFSAIFAFIMLAIYAAPYLTDGLKKNMFFKYASTYLFIPILAIMVSAYYLYGFAIAKDYFFRFPPKDFYTGLIWSLKSFFGPVQSINSFQGFFINIPIMIRIAFSFFGLYMFLRGEKNTDIKRFLTCVIGFILASLLLFSDMPVNIFKWWADIPFVGNLQTNRFLIYIQIGMYLFAAYGISKFLALFPRKKLVFILFLTSIFSSVFFHYIYVARDASRTVAQSPAMSDVFKVWDWIGKKGFPKEERVVYQDTVGNAADPILVRSDIFALSSIFTERPHLGLFLSSAGFPQEKCLRTDYGQIFGKSVDAVEAPYIKDAMNHFNAGYIVAVEPMLKNKLSGSNQFSKEKEYGVFTIFSMNDFRNRLAEFDKEADYKINIFENQRVDFNIHNKTVDNEIHIKIGYHPAWRAWLNDSPAKIEKDLFGLMKLHLPDKIFYDLRLSFNPVNNICVYISILGLIGSLIIICVNRNGTKNA